MWLPLRRRPGPYRGAALGGPGDILSKIAAGIIWLVGFGTVVLLWQKDSGAFFKARAQRSG
jgi:hypothetical protein